MGSREGIIKKASQRKSPNVGRRKTNTHCVPKLKRIKEIQGKKWENIAQTISVFKRSDTEIRKKKRYDSQSLGERSGAELRNKWAETDPRQ